LKVTRTEFHGSHFVTSSSSIKGAINIKKPTKKKIRKLPSNAYRWFDTVLRIWIRDG
jgi:hypothetical protein